MFPVSEVRELRLESNCLVRLSNPIIRDYVRFSIRLEEGYRNRQDTVSSVRRRSEPSCLLVRSPYHALLQFETALAAPGWHGWHPLPYHAGPHPLASGPRDLDEDLTHDVDRPDPDAICEDGEGQGAAGKKCPFCSCF